MYIGAIEKVAPVDNCGEKVKQIDPYGYTYCILYTFRFLILLYVQEVVTLQTKYTNIFTSEN